MVTRRRSNSTLRWEDVLSAYTIGMFPMADPDDGSISWYAPDPRGIIELEECRPSRSLRRTLRSGLFSVSWNTVFRSVLDACAERDETWISEDIKGAYAELHDRGLAHSVETWRNGSLVGGLYGVSLGGVFFGESMFTHETDASKVALITLTERMRMRGLVLLDAQFMTTHLQQFGCTNISRQQYMKRLESALSMSCSIYP